MVRDGAVFPDGSEVWVPIEPSYPDLLDVAGAKILVALGRLRPGVEPSAAARELGALSAGVSGGAPGARLTPLKERLLGDVHTPLLLLQAAVLLVLLAACANAGGLLLARTVRLRTALAVRTSLGAGGGRLARALLAEGLLLGLGAGLVGLGLATVLLRPTLALVPAGLPRLAEVSLEPLVVLVSLALASATGVATSLAPAVAGARTSPGTLLREAGGSAGSAPWLRRLLEGLVVGQVALAMLLTVGAGLLVRSFVSTVRQDPGFDPSRVTVVDISLPDYRYPDGAARAAFAHQLLERAAAFPGARRVALGRNLPVSGSNMTSPLMVEGSTETTAAVQIAAVTEGYFDVLGIPLEEGSGFGDADREGGPPVLVVDETVRTAEGRPLGVGERAHSFFGRGGMRDVVGLVGPVRHAGLRSAPVAVAYEPFFQRGVTPGFSLLVRSTAPASSVASAARALVLELDPQLPVDRVGTMADRVSRSLAEPRFYTVGLTVFGVLALLLALAGCQAGLAHRVAARRREMGLRMALGASNRTVRTLVVRRGMGLTAAGALLGILVALPASRLLRSQLYGVTSSDPLTYA
ncbi:MAG TPA: FtsX-like permease family protein, partial [Longimicrobiales bacterium]|nr:FtsX-like permease family protein [Longimicrobiales bacterium]